MSPAGREFRVVVLSTVHSCLSLLSPRAPASEFFTEARVLNTIMTRAQSQLVAVGDAVALCSFGACSRLWRSFIRECVEHHSVCPASLSLEQIEQSVAQRRHWAPVAPRAEAAGAAVARDTVAEAAAGGPATEHVAVARALSEPVTEGREVAVKVEAGAVAPRDAAAGAALEGRRPVDPEDWESDFWPSHGELGAEDAILQELLDESRQVVVTVGEDGLLDTVSRPESPQQAQQYTSLPPAMLRELLHSEPELHLRCMLLKETSQRATAIPLGNAASGPIQIRGRLNCGMAFTGDEVLVQVLDWVAGDGAPAGRPQGRVVGVLKRRRRELAFVCQMDRWDPRIMTPVDSSVTKIFVAELKDPLHIPIHRLVQGRVQRVGHRTLSAEARHTQLFWVQIVLWRERFYYPLGIVLEVLPEATTWEQGLRTLDLEHGLRTPVPDPASVSRVLQRYQAELGSAAGDREDCRSLLTFTVDPQDACYLDDALSVRDLGASCEVAVHITDVASFVPRDGALDVEARRQGLAFYAPNREPVLTLPASVCQEVLSLLPGRDRLAVSLFLTMEKGSGRLQSLRFAPSVICSDRQLSYEEAEAMIKGHPGAGLQLPVHLGSVEACVVAACYFSRELRRHRLQTACAYEPLEEGSELGSRAAHIMVKEYMVQFNRLAAQLLVQSEPTRMVTPLRWQPTPSSHQLEAVRERHGESVALSLHLQHYLHGHRAPGMQLHVLASLWKHVQLAARAQDYSRMVDLIATDDMHPSLAPAGLAFRRALGRSMFGRSSQGEQQLASHYLLQVDWYTWATSPIRRYLDVVVQRLLLLALGHGGPEYSARDIDGLCQDFGRQHACAKSYQRRAQSLYLATQLKAQPQNKLGFVVDVEMGTHCFKLLFPTNRETLPDPCPVRYSSLQLADHPRSLESRPGLRLLWRRRVYSVQKSRPSSPLPGTLQDPHTRALGAALWQRLLELVEEQRWPAAAALIQEQGREESPGREPVRVCRSPCGHFVEVVRELGSGDTLQVQLGTSLQRGFLAPALQLWTVVPGLSLCLEHVERPGDCFSGRVLQASQDRYHDEDAYSRVWGPLCSLESATNAVAESSSITLQHVLISWDAEPTPQGQLQGTFLLDAAFLWESCIHVNFSCCYLCIRLEGLQAPPARPSSLGPLLSIDPQGYAWVAHGLTQDLDQEDQEDRQEAFRRVHFFIHHTAMEKVPEEVLRPGTRFTVEVLPKQLPDL